MHIAFLTPEYPHSKVKHCAGLGTSIGNLCSALVSNGVRVTVIVYGQQQNEVFEENNITFHLLADKNYVFAKWFFYRKYIQNYVNRLVETEKVDVIEAPDWTGITAFMQFKSPLVIRFHGSDTYFCYLEKREQKLKNKWFEKLALLPAKAFIAPTRFAGETSAYLFGLPKEKITTIHYGLNLDQFKNGDPTDFQPGLLLYIGTIIRKKGVFELPEIFKKVLQKMPGAELILIGNDTPDIQTSNNSTWEMLQHHFGNTLEKVSYLGKIPYSEVQNYIKKANVCIFPTYAETLGMVTIESMAMQKAVVNSNIGWAQELMEDGKSGFLVHPSAHEEYALRIVQLLQDNELALEMGKQAREFVENQFGSQKIAKQNIDFYKTIIKE